MRARVPRWLGRLLIAGLLTVTAGGTAGASAADVDSEGSGSIGCRIGYGGTVWSSPLGEGGLFAFVSIDNTGQAPVNGWTLTFSFNDQEEVVHVWEAEVDQDGRDVVVYNVDENAVIEPGSQAVFRFQATSNGHHVAPHQFSLNGVLCDIRE